VTATGTTVPGGRIPRGGEMGGKMNILREEKLTFCTKILKYRTAKKNVHYISVNF
jgi:hypothetical protein